MVVFTLKESDADLMKAINKFNTDSIDPQREISSVLFAFGSSRVTRNN